MSSSATVVTVEMPKRAEEGGNSKPSTRLVYAGIDGGNDALLKTSHGSLVDNSTENRSTSSLGTIIRRPSTSGSIL